MKIRKYKSSNFVRPSVVPPSATPRVRIRPCVRPCDQEKPGIKVNLLYFHENMKIRILKFSYKIRLGVRPSARPSVCYSCVRPPSVHHQSTVRQLLHHPTVRACTSQPAIDTINYILMKIQKFKPSLRPSLRPGEARHHPSVRCSSVRQPT